MFAMVLITEVFSVTLGQAVAALSPSIFIAALFNPFLLVIFSLFCGVTIPQPLLNSAWRDWLYYVSFETDHQQLSCIPADLYGLSLQLNPFTWLVSGMIATAVHDLPIQCVSTTCVKTRD
jgi:ATP-binding cassette subfamily G (WHITE) protein 2 (SNQ2)